MSNIKSGSSAQVSTANTTDYCFNLTFSGTVYFDGTYNGQTYPKGTELIVNGKGYICIPDSNSDTLWQAGAEGLITVVSSK